LDEVDALVPGSVIGNETLVTALVATQPAAAVVALPAGKITGAKSAAVRFAARSVESVVVEVTGVIGDCADVTFVHSWRTNEYVVVDPDVTGTLI
jgi:hypothetical protein